MPHGIVTNMAAVEQSAYEIFRAGTEVDEMEMEEKIKGSHLRGKKYTVSQDGLCPRCGNSNRLYVILDKLFPMGDMPEILHTLIAKGRAILWSSQEKEGYKDPPTFLCRGFCPPDPLGAGFNVNWANVSLNDILESLDKQLQAINPVSSPQGSHSQGEESSQDESADNPYLVLDDFKDSENKVEKNTSHTSIVQSSFDKVEETEENGDGDVNDNDDDDGDDDDDNDDDDDDDELDEEELIKQMLAKEQQKLSQGNNDDDDDNDDSDRDKDEDDVQNDISVVPTDSEDFSEQSASSSNAISSTATVTASTVQTESSSKKSKSSSTPADNYPVSSTGRCPYCGASDVKYIIVVSENTRDTELPQSLQQLLKRNHAFKMAKGDSEPPSFQCQKCQYGFNLNWSKTNLEAIFGLPPATSTAASTTAALYTSTAYQTPYMASAAYSPYPRPSVPPPGYPPPVRVPPPVPQVPYHGYPGTYPGYYHGSYYPPPPAAVPPPVGAYLPYSPPGVPPAAIPYAGVPPPAVPPAAIPPPGIAPPGIAPPGITPPVIPPPSVPPPGIPPPGIGPPGFPPPRVPPHRIPPPRVPPTGIPPPRVPPPGILPPRVPPVPRVPLPGMPPPGMPPPRVPAAGYPPPAAAPAWGARSYPQPRPMYHTPPHYTPAPARGYLPPAGGRPQYPPQLRPQRPITPHQWHPVPAHSTASVPAATVPTQEVANAQQDAQGEVSKVAAARFEMVLNQIDKAKARVRHEKEQWKEFNMAVHGDQMPYQQQYNAEPNALTDEGQKMPEYEERPPGDDDIGFGSSVIITKPFEQEEVTESSVNTGTADHSVSPSQMVPADISEHPEATARENDALTRDHKYATARDNDPLKLEHEDATTRETEANARDVVQSAVIETEDDAMNDQNATNDDDVEAAPKTAVPTRGGRSKRQQKLLTPPSAASARQTRRSRRSEATTTTEDTDSTAAEEEEAVTGRSSRSRKTKPPSREVERLDIEGNQEDDTQGEVVTSDIEMGETSDVLSQSSVLPRTESDSAHELPSESLPSSSEPEAAVADVARPQRGRPTRGRKRKQGAAATGAAARKSRRMAAEEQLSEDKDEAEVEDMVVENPSVIAGHEDTQMAVTSPRVGKSRHGPTEVKQPAAKSSAVGAAEKLRTEECNSEQEESTAVELAADKQEAKVRTSKRQTRKTAQVLQEPEATQDNQASGAEETIKNRQTRRSVHTPETDNNRQTRKSVKLSSPESEMSDTKQHLETDQTQEIDTVEDKKGLVFQQEEKETISDTSTSEQEGKATRRTRKTRKSSVSNEDASGTREVFVSPQSDWLMTTQEAVGNRQTRSRKSPAVRNIQTTKSNPSAVVEDEQAPRTRNSRNSSASNEEATNEDVERSVEPATPEDGVSSRRTRRNKSKPPVQESSDLSQESEDLIAEGNDDEQAPVTPQRKASKKMAPMQSPETVTKRVTRSRQKK